MVSRLIAPFAVAVMAAGNPLLLSAQEVEADQKATPDTTLDEPVLQGNNESGITIISEFHTNYAFHNYIKQEIDSGNITQGSVVMLEQQALLNGPIQAFMDGRLDRDALEQVYEGYVNQDFVHTAEAWAETISNLKDAGAHVIAYDARLAMGARDANLSSMDYLEQSAKEAQSDRNAEYQDEIDELRRSIDLGNTFSAKLAQADPRTIEFFALRLETSPDDPDLEQRLLEDVANFLEDLNEIKSGRTISDLTIGPVKDFRTTSRMLELTRDPSISREVSSLVSAGAAFVQMEENTAKLNELEIDQARYKEAVDFSVQTIRQYHDYSPVAQNVEAYVTWDSKADSDVNASIVIHQELDRLAVGSDQPQEQPSIFVHAGEGHVNGMLDPNIPYQGILDEALEAQGFSIEIHAVRDSATEFIFFEDQASSYFEDTAERSIEVDAKSGCDSPETFDRYVIIDPVTLDRTEFTDREQLRNVAWEGLSEDQKEEFDGPEDLPVADICDAPHLQEAVVTIPIKTS